MRPLAEYSWRDWQLFRPLTHCYKTMRYAACLRQAARRQATDRGAAECKRGRMNHWIIPLHAAAAIDAERTGPKAANLARLAQAGPADAGRLLHRR